MNRFLTRTGLFILLGTGLLLSGIAMSTALRGRTFQPDKNYFCRDFRKGYLEHKPGEIILLGNSRVLSGLSASGMERITGRQVLQLGFSSSDISVTRLVLESYLKVADSPPSLVVLEVSWFTFNPNRTGFHRKISGDLVLNDPCLLAYSIRYPELFQGWATQAMLHALPGKDRPYTDYTLAKLADYPGNDSTRKSYEVDVRGMERIFPEHLAGIDPLLLEDFNAIADECRDRHIRLVLYTGPEDEDYSMMQRDRAEVRDIFVKTAEAPGVFYLDYTNGGRHYQKSDENLLLNSDHIYFDDIFTRRFVADLRKQQLL